MAHPYMANSTPRADARSARRRRRRRRRGAVRADPGGPPRVQRPARAPARSSRSEADAAPPPARRWSTQRRLRGQPVSFLGAGVWQHHVPAVCDEIAGRTEFLTPVWGTPSSDLGRNQAWFEFASQLGELLELDFVGLPVYSWGCAAGHAIRMAARLTGRAEVLVPASIWTGAAGGHPHLLRAARGQRPRSRSSPVDCDPATGRLDLDALAAWLADTSPRSTSRPPTSLGVIETATARDRPPPRARRAPRRSSASTRSRSACSPPPGDLGADIVVGSTQPLGVHLNAGGGVGGFIATRDEERYAREYPTLQVSIAPTIERGRARLRHDAVRPVLLRLARGGQRLDRQLRLPVGGRQRRLHGADRPAGVRASSGETILQRSHYAAQRLAERRRRRGALAAASSRSSSSTSTAPAAPSPRSTPACASAASSAARTCRATSRSSASPRSTA